MAAFSTIAAAAAIGASVFSVGSSLKQRAPIAPATPVVPLAPDPDAAARATEAALARKSRTAKGYLSPTGEGAELAGRSATLLTGPGATTPAPVAYKTLLGA